MMLHKIGMMKSPHSDAFLAQNRDDDWWAAEYVRQLYNAKLVKKITADLLTQKMATSSGVNAGGATSFRHDDRKPKLGLIVPSNFDGGSHADSGGDSTGAMPPSPTPIVALNDDAPNLAQITILKSKLADDTSDSAKLKTGNAHGSSMTFAPAFSGSQTG